MMEQMKKYFPFSFTEKKDVMALVVNVVLHIAASWSEFRRQLMYKADWYGKKVVCIDRFYPSSQLCSECGTQWSGTKDLKIRKWVCPNCGTNLNRDTNAALNILHEGMRILA